MSTQKLQKVLAIAGLGSRREIEQWIASKRLIVNEQVASLGIRVGQTDQVSLDGRVLDLASAQENFDTKILLYYKRYNEICTVKDPQGRRTVFENLPAIHPRRWIMMGRLDFNTLGLLLFTTDGLLSHRLLHPRYEIEREYAVRVHGALTPTMIKFLKKGVLLDGKRACFSSISLKNDTQGKNHWYHVILKEGRQREVRRLFATQGIIVNRLLRIRFGPIKLPQTLSPGELLWLSQHEINQLKACVDL